MLITSKNWLGVKIILNCNVYVKTGGAWLTRSLTAMLTFGLDNGGHYSSGEH